MTREEATKIIKDYEVNGCGYCHQGGDEVEEAFKMAIEAIEQTKWIPVSERLPEEGETVLVCYQTQGGVAQSVCEWFEMRNGGIVWSTLCGEKPIAWMPLPESYKPTDSEKE